MTERRESPDAVVEPLGDDELRTERLVSERDRYELAELVAISRALSSERDIRKLLGLILEKSRQVTGADAGSVYIVEDQEKVEEKRDDEGHEKRAEKGPEHGKTEAAG